MNPEPRIYGKWAGNPKGIPEHTAKCIEEVYGTCGYTAYVPYQCNRKRGYGKDGLYCKQHAKKNPSPEPEV